MEAIDTTRPEASIFANTSSESTMVIRPITALAGTPHCIYDEVMNILGTRHIHSTTNSLWSPMNYILKNERERWSSHHPYTTCHIYFAFLQAAPGTTQTFKIKRNMILGPTLMAKTSCFLTSIYYASTRRSSAQLLGGVVHKMEHDKTKGCEIQTDIRWTFHPSESEPHVFAVLEIKAPNLLSWDDFAAAPNESLTGLFERKGM